VDGAAAQQLLKVASGGLGWVGRADAWPPVLRALVTSDNNDLLSFIGSSFRSVWALELLLLLKRERRPWPNSELVAALRASDLVVSKALDGLIAAGLASGDEQGAVYMPVNDKVAARIEETEQLYLTRPNAVRRAIVAASTSSATAFADAFRLKKE
jgi:hypothetical protein